MELGGPIVTAGGVVFAAGTREPYLRAFNKSTGEELWKGKLPAPAQATPMTYSINGRQFVVIAAGGHGLFETPKGTLWSHTHFPSKAHRLPHAAGDADFRCGS
jgi:quinoprotein glucose dehydrogenase